MLKRLLSLILVSVISGCTIINNEEFMQVYINSLTNTIETNYANYQDKKLEEVNREINDGLINELVKRISATPLLFTSDQIASMDYSINKFRNEKLVINLIDVNEKTNVAKLNVKSFNIYDEFLKAVNSNNVGILDGVAFTELVKKSIIDAFDDCKSIDVGQVIINVDDSKIYSIDNNNQSIIFKRILNIE